MNYIHSSFTHSFKRGERREWDEPRDSLSAWSIPEGEEERKGDRKRDVNVS